MALTGNIAAGKTAVADVFRSWGATIIDADELTRAVQAPSSPVLAAIAERFGDSILQPDGSLDRRALRHLVLHDAAALADLNLLVHPAVQQLRAEQVEAARRRGDPVVVSVIPLLFEAADPAAFDAIVFVDAPAPIRRARLIADRGLAPDEADRIMAAQAPAGPKRARSDHVIDNGSDRKALQHAARAVWNALTRA